MSLWFLFLIAGLLVVLAGALAKALLLYRELQHARSQLGCEQSARQRVASELEQREQSYNDLFEHLNLGLFQTTVDGKLIRVNPALAAEAGYASPQEMINSVADAGRELYIPEFYLNPSCRADVLSWAAQNESPITYEADLQRKSGEQIRTSVALRLVGAAPGREPYLEGSIEDITERKRALEFVEAQRDLGIELSAASCLNQALPLCLDAAIYVAGMDSGEIYLWDSESGMALLAAGKGFRPACLSLVRSNAELSTTLLETVREPFYADYRECEIGQLGGCDATLGARAIIPIVHEGTRIGWLMVRSHALRSVPAFSRTALETIGSQIGSAIARLQAQEALTANQCELRTLFDSLNDFLLVIDPRGRILDANRALIERSGYTRQELQAMCITALYPLRLQLDGMVGGLMGGELNFISAPMVAKDGSVIPVETRLGIGNWDRQKVIIGLGRDLTERRKAEEQTASLREKTALLKEIHHRVKNNLQIICSLLSLQASRLEPGQPLHAFRESQARVRAIALLHEKLYQSRDLSRVEIGEYLGALAQDVLRAYSSRELQLRLDVEPAYLNQDTVMPCGLVVNEIVTNSCKYAFPDHRSGEIFLSVKPGEVGTLILRVGDNGVGLPPGLDPRKTTTLGLQLVDDMVYQLRGTWSVERSPGTTIEIIFPAERTES